MTKKTTPAYRASKEETIPINKLHPFSNHPFHIRHDLEFSELVDSISESGIITPIIVRPKVGVGYEVISGHRRWEACKELGIESIPARVEYIDDDEATILMVNSNIQREHVLPSEKAFAYKMRMEAMKHQGKATSSQLGTKLRTLDAMGKEVDESRNQIHRYIRLTYLIPFSILYDFKDDLRYEKKLKWKEVGKRLEYLVRMDRYLTDAEREKMPAWINRQTESKPLPPPIPDQKPVCEAGSTVYLENDQRFTVESIGQFDVHLRNEDFPLVGRAVSREQFQQLLDANPRNGGMVLSEQQRESLVQEQREQALSYIEDYLKDEFEITEPDFSNLTQIGLGYTTTEDEQHTIQVNADLEHCTISKFVDDTLYAQEKFSSLEEMNRKFLSILDFDSLMEVDINEIEEQEPEISADEPEESTFVSQVMQDVDRLAVREKPAEYDRTNYLAPYEPAIPEGAKAKFAANVQAIRTLKEIEQRMASGGAPATEQEQDILAGYLGWGGLADAFDPSKDNWHTEYEQLKTLLTEDEYAAARESTLTAFYTPPAVIHAMYLQ